MPFCSNLVLLGFLIFTDLLLVQNGIGRWFSNSHHIINITHLLYLWCLLWTKVFTDNEGVSGFSLIQLCQLKLKYYWASFLPWCFSNCLVIWGVSAPGSSNSSLIQTEIYDFLKPFLTEMQLFSKCTQFQTWPFKIGILIQNKDAVLDRALSI